MLNEPSSYDCGRSEEAVIRRQSDEDQENNGTAALRAETAVPAPMLQATTSYIILTRVCPLTLFRKPARKMSGKKQQTERPKADPQLCSKVVLETQTLATSWTSLVVANRQLTKAPHILKELACLDNVDHHVMTACT
jgi:hypothetical protein